MVGRQGRISRCVLGFKRKEGRVDIGLRVLSTPDMGYTSEEDRVRSLHRRYEVRLREPVPELEERTGTV